MVHQFINMAATDGHAAAHFVFVFQLMHRLWIVGKVHVLNAFNKKLSILSDFPFTEYLKRHV